MPGAGVRGAAGAVGFGVERDLVGLGGVWGRVRPRRALCAGFGVSRVLLPDSMLRRRQYGVEVIWAALLAVARQQPWNQIAAGLGVPYTTVREWLRRFARRADRAEQSRLARDRGAQCEGAAGGAEVQGRAVRSDPPGFPDGGLRRVM